MTSRSRRGGYQRPSNPAAVSGPGKFSQRTDGGPTQPVRELPAEATGGYGTRQAHADLQAAAPMPDGGGGGGAPMGAPLPAAGVFGPTERPDQALTAGIEAAPEPMLAPDPVALLRAIYVQAPSHALLQTIRWMERHR